MVVDGNFIIGAGILLVGVYAIGQTSVHFFKKSINSSLARLGTDINGLGRKLDTKVEELRKELPCCEHGERIARVEQKVENSK